MYFIKREEETKKVLSHLENDGMCVISGGAGIGKTCFIRHLLSDRDNVTFMDPCDFPSGYVNAIQNDIDTKRRNWIYVFDEVINVDELMGAFPFEVMIERLDIKVVFVTRQTKFNEKYNVVQLRTISEEETRNFLTSSYNNFPEEEIPFIYELSHGHPVMMILCAETLMQNKYPSDDIIRQFAAPEIKGIIEKYSINTKSKAKTSGEGREILFQIFHFGPIEKGKLYLWNERKIVDDAVSNLTENLFVTTYDGKLYATARVMKFSKKEKKRYSENLLRTFIRDQQNVLKNEKDVYLLIDILRQSDLRIKFVADYYEESYRASEKSMLEEQKALMEEQRACILKILGNQNECNQRLVAIEDRLLDYQNEILSSIQQLMDCSGDNLQIQKQLEDLSEIIKNPKKSKLESINAILGTIGSIASISSVMGVNNWPELFGNLTQMISHFMTMIH